MLADALDHESSLAPLSNRWLGIESCHPSEVFEKAGIFGSLGVGSDPEECSGNEGGAAVDGLLHGCIPCGSKGDRCDRSLESL